MEPDDLIDIVFSEADGVFSYDSADGTISTKARVRWLATERLIQAIKSLSDGPVICRVEERSPLGHYKYRLLTAGVLYREPKPVRTPQRPWPEGVPPETATDRPDPVYASWSDYLERTTYAERMKRCYAASKKSNRRFPHIDGSKITGRDIWNVIEAAEGRCVYCRSLAVENRPSHPLTGGPLPWAHVGRRVGSLEHKTVINGRNNDPENLAWACLWCNTWGSEREPLADNHGGHYPPE